MIISIISILGLLLGGFTIWLFYSDKKQPIFIYKDDVIQTKEHLKISIYYGKKKIENLARLQIIFFNNGKGEIRKEDIPENSHFPWIKLTDARILSSTIRSKTCEEIDFTVNTINDNTIELDFDYLNYKDGGIAEVLYEKKNDKTIPANVKLYAKIKGVHKNLVLRDYYKIDKGWDGFIGTIIFIAAALISIFITVKVTKILGFDSRVETLTAKIYEIGAVIGGFLIFCLLLMIFFYYYSRIRGTDIPSKLKKEITEKKK